MQEKAKEKGGKREKKEEKLEMCQYDMDAPTKGHNNPHAGILQKMKLEKAITLKITGRFYPNIPVYKI